jgi:hypothetical protein
MCKFTAFVLIAIVVTALHSGCGVTATTDDIDDLVGPVTGSDDGTDNSDSTGTTTGAAITAAQASAHLDTHEDADDCSWDVSAVAHIVLNGSSIAVDTGTASVDGSTVTITAAGTYSLSGSLSSGQIVVEAPDDEDVRLILSGVSISNNSSAPIFIRSADEVIIVLADGTENHLADAATYVLDELEAEEPKAALFSKADLTICGNGALVVDGNYNDAISSQDGLVIVDGTITVTAVDDGIRGKDYIVIHDGVITADVGGNGLISDNEEDAARGFIFIDGGEIDVVADGDAISAATDVMISDGDFTLSSGGGSGGGPYNTAVSAKGIKGSASLVVDDGVFDVDSADDGLHSNGSMTINGGDFVVATGDDGAHANDGLYVNGGRIRITRSYEGLESNSAITINGGEIHIASSDDGVNVASGNDGSGIGGPGFPGGPFGWNDQSSGDCYLYINGGYLAVVAGGDGIDVNGAVEMSGGVVLIDGPTADNNGALDHLSLQISGGFLVATGSAGMPGVPSTTSSQCSLVITYSQWRQADTLIHLETSGSGAELLTYAPSKPYRSCVFSSPDLQANASFALYQGGSSTGTITDGLYNGGIYEGGTLLGTAQLSNVVTSVRAP